jgi:2-methylisocitrate lyase-like PEP mutase family enzyme
VIAGPSVGKAAAFLALHTGPGFVLPNAWDAGSARILEQVGFPAVATTSAGIAWSCGVPDGGTLDRATMLEHVARIPGTLGFLDGAIGYADLQRRFGS